MMSPLSRLSSAAAMAALLTASCAPRVGKEASPAAYGAPSSTTGGDSDSEAKPSDAPTPQQQQPGYAPTTTVTLPGASEVEFTRLEDAEAALMRAFEDLGGELPEKKKKPAKDGVSDASARPAATTQPAPLGVGDPRCANACKAFASLRRAADAVCRLAGDSNARCSRAREIVKDSEERVKSCSCGEKDP